MRYEAIQADGRWYVLDHAHPEAEPFKCVDEEAAIGTAVVWNLIDQWVASEKKYLQKN